ncbi:Type 1 glutamine amidotransferase-like domain-containing protein, partial [bacterium]|nr:Type 1 glutamine amidotransferase-like domain-containing protein [bacterium]
MDRIGSIFLNGNVQNERDLFVLLRDYFINPTHIDEEIRENNMMLLGTATWKKGELNTHHIEDYAINQAITNKFDNLKAYTNFQIFEEKEPKLYEKYHEKQIKIIETKKKYFVSNQVNVRTIFKLLKEVKQNHPQVNLWDVVKIKDVLNESVSIQDLKSKNEDQIKHILTCPETIEKCNFARKLLIEIMDSDEEVFEKVIEIEKSYLENPEITENSLYLEQRQEMVEKIEKSASIVFFGGHTYVINNRMRFYQLGEPLEMALNNGTNIFGISAGSIFLMDKFHMNFDIGFPGGFLRAEDYGVGVVHHIVVFPHANEYDYFTEPKPDYLSFLAI